MPYVINPETGKSIKKGGPTYEKLLAKGVSLRGAKAAKGRKAPRKRTVETTITARKLAAIERMPMGMRGSAHGRGGRTAGWKAAAPRRGPERRLMMEECGEKCFLAPKSLGFPICAKCGKKSCGCKVDCRGVLSAKIRARQYSNRYPKISAAAQKLQDSLCR